MTPEELLKKEQELLKKEVELIQREQQLKTKEVEASQLSEKLGVQLSEKEQTECNNIVHNILG